MDDVLYVSAATLARAIRRKEVSSAEVVQAYLQRIDAVNPTLNVVVHLCADAALAEARAADGALARGQPIGPLHGVPMTIKDWVCPTFYTRGGAGICGPCSINSATSRERYFIA